MIGPVDRGKGPLNTEALWTEMGATRAALEQVAALTRLAKAHVQLEGLLSAVQLAIARGERVAGLSADAERIARSLGGLAADPGRLAATVKLAMQIKALCAPGSSHDGSSALPGTDLET